MSPLTDGALQVDPGTTIKLKEKRLNLPDLVLFVLKKGSFLAMCLMLSFSVETSQLSEMCPKSTQSQKLE